MQIKVSKIAVTKWPKLHFVSMTQFSIHILQYGTLKMFKSCKSRSINTKKLSLVSDVILLLILVVSRTQVDANYNLVDVSFDFQSS